MHQEHVGNDSSGESSPWVGICVIDSHLPRAFPDSPPFLCPSVCVSEQECVNGSPVSQRRTLLHCTGVNNSSSPRLNILMRRK